MKATVKATALLLLTGALLAGCGAQKESSRGKEVSGSRISAKPVEFTYFNIFNNMPFNPEWPVFQKVAENTNISLKGVASQSASDERSAFNLMVTSGDLPDIIGYLDMSKLESLGREGGLIPLNDLIAEHAPDIQKLLDENPDYKKAATSLDGNIYFIPKFMEVEVAMGYYIRTDWLKKLNLELPQNLDELYTVLKAFKTQDPNGNGLADEVPFFRRNPNGNLWNLFYIWDASSEFDLKNGKVVYGPMEEEFRLAMTTMSQWYSEGLIDPEIFTRGLGARDALLGQNLGGFTHDWFGSTANYNTKLAGQIEGFEFLPMAPVVNQKGERKEKTARNHVPGWGISASCEDPATVMKLFNYFFTPEGHKLINYGIEGDTYDLVDGKPVYTDKVMHSDKTALATLRSFGVQYRIGMLQDFAYEKAWLNQIAADGMQSYIDGGYVNRVIPQNEGELYLKYTPEQEKEYLKIMSQVKNYTLEMIQKWMIGSADFEKTYPEYLQRLKERGIDRAISINQEAYSTYVRE